MILVEGLTQRSVARELGLSQTTVGKHVGQAAPARKAGPDLEHGRCGTRSPSGFRRC